VKGERRRVRMFRQGGGGGPPIGGEKKGEPEKGKAKFLRKGGLDGCFGEKKKAPNRGDLKRRESEEGGGRKKAYSLKTKKAQEPQRRE